MTEYRAVFDAEVTFLNGGGLQTQGSGWTCRPPTSPTTSSPTCSLAISAC